MNWNHDTEFRYPPPRRVEVEVEVVCRGWFGGVLAGATCSKNLTRRREATGHPIVRVGFVPLIDAAPLIVAAEHGFFADEGLDVRLHRQIGWGNVRDKLTFGRLHASHALLGMPLSSVLGRDGFSEPLVAVMNLGCGADAITFGPTLIRSGVKTVAQLAERCRSRAPGQQPVFAHVFGCSVHHYLLRGFLAAAGINPDTDVRLCVLPPLQVAEHARQEYLDGFCCGEPWNTLASRDGGARIVAVTSDLLPHHPDKVLALKRDWADAHPETVLRLVRAVLRALKFLAEAIDPKALAELLARPAYLDLPAGVIEQSLSLLGSFARPSAPADRGSGPSMFDPRWAFPDHKHHAWLGAQMIRWGHLPEQADWVALGSQCVQTGAFQTASAQLAAQFARESERASRQRPTLRPQPRHKPGHTPIFARIA